MKVNLRHTLYEKEKASIEVESGCIGVDPGVVWGFNGTAFLLLTRKRQQSCQMILKIEQTSFHYASTYRSMYTHCVCLHISISKLIYLYMYVCMYKCMYVCMYVQYSTVHISCAVQWKTNLASGLGCKTTRSISNCLAPEYKNLYS